MTEERCDVVVIGGGPGGSSTAAVLAGRGHRVLVLERESFPRFHIGESLLPAAWELWDQIGVTPALEAADFPIKQGVNFSMFSSKRDIQLLTGEFPQYFQRPYTYHVDRARFDSILLDNAARCGVEVRQGWEARDVLFEGTCAVGVEAGPVGGPYRPIRSRAVVDASGRSCLLARKLGWRRPDPALNKLSYFTHFEGAFRPQASTNSPVPVIDGSTMTDIHTIEGGWIWYIPLAKDVVSVGAVLDADFVRDLHGLDMQARFDRAVGASPRITQWLSGAKQTMGTRTISNISYLNDSFVGDGFALVGDASMFVDPIFSAGVTLAIRGGVFAGEEIANGLEDGDLSAGRLKRYEDRIRHPMTKIFRMIYNWYNILKKKNADNVFERSQRAPLLRERLIVLLSGGYDKMDMEVLLSADG
jgi:halogenation protein CepH